MNDHASPIQSGPSLSRRGFLSAVLGTAGTFTLAVQIPQSAQAAARTTFQPDAFIRISSSGSVTLINASVEMGQGTFTSIPMIVAEELGVGVDQLVVEQAPADEALYKHPIWTKQITGGSGSIRGLYEPMRRAGATARAMLVTAAANRWKVDPSQCRVERGVVYHDASKRKATFAQLAAAAAKLPLPTDVALKPVGDFRIIGQPVRRTDTLAKSNGSAVFGIDVSPARMKIAAIAVCPILGGTLAGVDEKSALATKGVRRIIRLENAVAVIADHYGAARKALDLIEVKWNGGANAALQTAAMVADIKAAAETSGIVAKVEGDPDSAFRNAATVFTADYELPMLAHAAMEPLNCTVHVRKDGCDIWVGTQAPVSAQAAASALTGLPADRVKVHNQLLGGGYGRKLDVDYIELAIRVAQQSPWPVKVIWSREEDTQHDAYRAHNYSRITVGLDEKGKPTAFSHRIVGPAILARFLPIFFVKDVDYDIIDGGLGAYRFPTARIEYVRHEAPAGILTGNWRGVGPTRNLVGVETVIDELANKAGSDPIEYRRELLAHSPRATAVMDLVAGKVNWPRKRESGSGAGIAVIEGFGSYAALYAEVSVKPDGSVKMERMVCAVDCGTVINPNTVEAQIQGGILFGLTAALYGKITISQGRVEQGNFDTYRPLRIDEAPPITVHIVPSAEKPGGVGEVGTAIAAPALLNAIAAATGKRLRTLPVDTGLLKTI